MGMTSFGFGQRACLGQNVTQDEMLVSCGGLLWAFNLAKKIDPKTGAEIDPPLDKTNSLLIIKPDPWQMAFHPRTPEKKQQVIDDWEAAEKETLAKRAAFEETGRMARAAASEKSEKVMA